jgi:hypothetical protein
MAEQNGGEFDLTKIVVDYYDDNASSEEKEQIRNELIDKSIMLIDARYEAFMDDFSFGKKSLDAGADIASIAADAVATLIAPASTKSILAAVSGGITASKLSFDEAFFYEKTLPVLLNQMQANRQAVLVDLVQGRKLDGDAYPLTAALRDISRYYTAGTIDGALIEIQQQAAEKQKQATAKLNKQLEKELETAQRKFERTLTWLNSDPDMVLTAKAAIKIWWSEKDTTHRTSTALARAMHSFAKEFQLDLTNLPLSNHVAPTLAGGSTMTVKPAEVSDFIEGLPTDAGNLQKTKSFIARLYAAVPDLTIPQ